MLNEGHTIQNRCFKRTPTISRSSSKHQSQPDLARKFAKLMFREKYGAASALLSEEKTSGVLGENDALKSKHPSAQCLNQEAIPPLPNPVMFVRIDADSIRHAAKGTTGAAGPSGLDAHNWRRICTFKEASDDLFHSLALLAHTLCTQVVDHSILALSLACRLIALDKNPGVRPIGVCEVPRRIISKAILHVIKGDIQEAAGATQLCGGQIAGIEAAVHAVRQLISSENTEGILIVDTSNAFNSLNRANALANSRYLCPPFYIHSIDQHLPGKH